MAVTGSPLKVQSQLAPQMALIIVHRIQSRSEIAGTYKSKEERFQVNSEGQSEQKNHLTSSTPNASHQDQNNTPPGWRGGRRQGLNRMSGGGEEGSG